jgi:hypothetical protein
MNLAVDECQQIKDTHGPMFSQYQTMMKEIELDIVLKIIDKFVKENNILESGIEDQAENKGNRKTEVTLECLFELLKTVTGHVIREKEDALEKIKAGKSQVDLADSVMADSDPDFVTKASRQTMLFVKKSNYNIVNTDLDNNADRVILIGNSDFPAKDDVPTSMFGDESPFSPTSDAIAVPKLTPKKRRNYSLDQSKAEKLGLHPDRQNPRPVPKLAQSMHEKVSALKE